MEQDREQTGVMVVLTALIGIIVAAVLTFGVYSSKPSTPAPNAAAADEAPAPIGEAFARFYFASGKAEVPSEDAAVMAKVAELAKTESKKIVLLSGFHDASGDPAKNAELAKQRALSVRAALVALGVEEARIKLRKPETTLADGKAEEARRVEVRVQ